MKPAVRSTGIASIAIALMLASAAPALATDPVNGLTSCAPLQSAPLYGIYDVTPYAICTQPPLGMMQKPDTVRPEDCSGKAPALLDACRYLLAAINAFALTSLYLPQYKSTGELAVMREAGAGPVIYIDYIQAHLFMVGNGIKAQALGIEKIRTFASALAAECTSAPSSECNDRLAKLNAALRTATEMQTAQGKMARSLANLATAVANDTGTQSQQIDLLEQAGNDAEALFPVLQQSWPPIKEALNSLEAKGAGTPNKVIGNTGGSVISLPLPLSNISVAGVIGRVINALLGIVGALALLLFVWGGLTWMTAAGDSSKVDKAKKTITWAALGLLAIFASYTILNLVITAFR